MRTLWLCLLLATALTAGSGQGSAGETRTAQILDRFEHANQWRDHVMIAAHRAGSMQAGKTIYAENSLAAVEGSIAIGAEIVEVDVRRSKDGAFVIMHDTSLDALCRMRPKSLAELRNVPGFGERKTQSYGPQILQAFERFRSGARATAVAKKLPKPSQETKALLQEGRTFEEIAAIRGRRVQTVMETVAELVEAGDIEFNDAWIDPEKRQAIEAAWSRADADWLKPVKDQLPDDYTYDEIRLVRAKLRRKKAEESAKPISAD